MANPNVFLNQLTEITVVNVGSWLLIQDSITGLTFKIKANLFLPIITQNYEWQPDKNYGNGESTTRDGKWWQSKHGGNVGNIPTEDTHWTEISKSSTGSLPAYAPGIFPEDKVFVTSNHTGHTQIYELIDATRPYVSSNLVTEIAAGDWRSVEERFPADIVVTLSGGKTMGKYTNGQTIPALGKTAAEVLLDMAIDYLAPAFTAFAMTGQQTTVELGTQISAGAKTFTWSTSNSGNVDADTVTIRDQSAATDLETGLANDGTESVDIGPAVDLLDEGDTQIYRILADNTQSASFQRDFTITADYKRFYGTPATVPANSANVRALGGETFGNTFSIAIPQGDTIIAFAYEATRPDIVAASVKYVEGFNSNVGNTFAKFTFNVNDAAGTPRSYKVWVAQLGAPFPADATYNVTIP